MTNLTMNIDTLNEYKEELNRQVHFTSDNQRIVFTDGNDYEIPLYGCKTENEILHWVKKLCDKNWVTTDILSHFISLACKHHNIDIKHS